MRTFSRDITPSTDLDDSSDNEAFAWDRFQSQASVLSRPVEQHCVKMSQSEEEEEDRTVAAVLCVKKTFLCLSPLDEKPLAQRLRRVNSAPGLLP
jgi:hypothetical protein